MHIFFLKEVYWNIVDLQFFVIFMYTAKEISYVYIYIHSSLIFKKCILFLKVFIEFVTIMFLFYVLVFDPKACGILTPLSGIQLISFALKSEVLTARSPGKCLSNVF